MSALLAESGVSDRVTEPGTTTVTENRSNRLRNWSFIGLCGLAAGLMFLIVKHSLIDDAYITLAYAKNLALHFHWGLNPYEVSNSATSPLNVILLGALSFITRIAGSIHPVIALGILSIGLIMVMAWSWTRIMTILRLPMTVAVLGIAVIMFNPIVLSAIGLEVLLIPAVLLLMLAMAMSRKPVLFGVVAGLAMITRIDMVIFVLIIAFASGGIRNRRAIGWATLSTALVGLPWYIFSWFFFGSAITDTFLIKTTQHSFGAYTFFTGPISFFLGRHLMTMLAFGPAVLGTIAVLAWLAVRFGGRWNKPGLLPALGPAAGLGIGGIVYYIAYSAIGVPPYHWYYVPSTTSLATFLVIALGAWWVSARREPLLRPGAPMVSLIVVALVVLGNIRVEAEQGIPWRSPVIFGNWASSTDYARVGLQLGQVVGDKTVNTPDEIGTIAYFCGCDIVNEFADPGVVTQLVNKRISEAGPIGKFLLNLNYTWLNRDRQPKPVQYVLNYYPGPGTGPDTWQVYADGAGTGHLVLTPAKP